LCNTLIEFIYIDMIRVNFKEKLCLKSKMYGTHFMKKYFDCNIGLKHWYFAHQQENIIGHKKINIISENN